MNFSLKIFPNNILAAVHTGFSDTHINKFLSTINVPGISNSMYKRHEREIGPVIEIIAKESCAEAAKLERKLTIENLEELEQLL